MQDMIGTTLSRCNSADKKELRGLHDADLVSALDALALAKGLERTAYVDQVLKAHVVQSLSELNVVMAALRGNPYLTECSRSHP